MNNFFVETRRGRTFVQTPGTGAPLVFIHGARLTYVLWTQQIETFSDLFECVGYDLRGHGRSGPSNLKRYSIGTFAEGLAEILEAVALRRRRWLCLSMGGVVAHGCPA